MIESKSTDDRTKLLHTARALNPTHPSISFESELYVKAPDSGAQTRVARWCRRDPTAHMLFSRGIGSGKTTELLKAREVIERDRFAHGWHLKLDAYFELRSPREGLLVTLAGLAMSQLELS